MKSNNFIFLSELNQALYKEEQFPLDSESSSFSKAASGGGSGVTSTGEWTIHYAPPGSTSYDEDYNEYVMDSPGGGIVKGIYEEASPEKVIYVIDLPEPTETRRITMHVEDTVSKFEDKVAMKQVSGSYAAEYAAHAGTFTFEGPNFFMVPVTGGYQTFVDINQAGVYALLEHSSSKTFNVFRFSFLAQTL